MTTRRAAIGPEGDLELRVIRGGKASIPARPLSFRDVLRYGWPQATDPEEVQDFKTRNLPRLFAKAQPLKVAALNRLGMPYLQGALFLKVLRPGRAPLDLGLVSVRVVTDAGATAIADAFMGTFTLSNFNFHGIGTGTTPAAVGDTALQTELTTEYSPDNTRATGVKSKPSAKVYQSVGTNTLDSGNPAVTEHGVLDQAATAGGTLLDRHTFAAINLDGGAGEGLESTYQLTINSGG